MKIFAALISTLFASPAFAADWSGLYFGPNAGYALSNISSPGYSADLSGAVLGGQAGANLQFGSAVFGVEGDFQGTLQRKSDNLGVASLEHHLPWFGTLRGRVGYATGQSLLYVTAGAASMRYDGKLTGPAGSVSDGFSRLGWVVGGGVEWMMTEKWSARLEYLHLDTGSQSVTLFAAPLDVQAKQDIVRVGLNYHF